MSSSREGGKDYSICQLINLIKPETLNQTNWNLAKVSQIIFVLVNNKIVAKNHGAIRNFLEPPIFAKNVFFNSSYFKCLLIPIIFVDTLFRAIFRTQTVWKVSKFEAFSGPYFPAFGLNTGKYGPEKTPYLDTFHAIKVYNSANISILDKQMFCINSTKIVTSWVTWWTLLFSKSCFKYI